MQAMAHSHMLQQQRQAQARQAMMQQQQFTPGVPMNIPGGMNPAAMNAAQFAAIRGQVPPNMRPVPLPQHLQQAQQQAQLGLEQQQAQAAQQHQVESRFFLSASVISILT